MNKMPRILLSLATPVALLCVWAIAELVKDARR